MTGRTLKLPTYGPPRLSWASQAKFKVYAERSGLCNGKELPHLYLSMEKRIKECESIIRLIQCINVIPRRFLPFNIWGLKHYGPQSTCFVLTHLAAEDNGTPLLHFLFLFFLLLLLWFVLPWKLYDETVQNKYEIELKDETPRLECTQTVTGKEQRTSTNSIVANDETKTKQEEHVAADVHHGESEVQCWQHIQLERGT